MRRLRGAVPIRKDETPPRYEKPRDVWRHVEGSRRTTSRQSRLANRKSGARDVGETFAAIGKNVDFAWP